MPNLSRIFDAICETPCEIFVMAFVVTRFTQTPNESQTRAEWTGLLPRRPSIVATVTLSAEAREELCEIV